MYSSQTSCAPDSGSPSRFEKTKYVHYGFLTVEAWCAYGVPFHGITSLRGDLTGSESVMFLDSVRESEMSSNGQLTGAIVEGEKFIGFPKCHQRQLSTWPVNSLWSECLMDLGIRDVDASNAAEQLSAFQRDMVGAWQGHTKPQKAFMAIVQLWYYHMPVDKVCERVKTVCNSCVRFA